MRITLRSAATTAVAALALSLLSVPAATTTATAATPTIETVFNDPVPDGPEKYQIPTRIVELINQAASGTNLYLSVYGLTRPASGSGAPDVVQALLNAQNDRNVKLYIVGEAGSPWGTAAYQELQTAIANKNNGGDLTLCQNSCLGNGSSDGAAINHQKFLVIDQLTDGTANVVAQSSANFATGQGGELNNLVVVKGNSSLRTSYVDEYLLQRQYVNVSGTHTHAPAQDMPEDSGMQTFFSPRDPAADLAAYGDSDIAGAMIDKVVCSPSLTTDRIRISGAGLDKRTSRPGLYAAIERAKNAGCTVEMNGQADSSGVDDMTALDVPLYGTRAGGCRYTTVYCSRGMVHSK